ncbi:unnamed protein product, partial [Amoebophrya sp. A25]
GRATLLRPFASGNAGNLVPPPLTLESSSRGSVDASKRRQLLGEQTDATSLAKPSPTPGTPKRQRPRASNGGIREQY